MKNMYYTGGDGIWCFGVSCSSAISAVAKASVMTTGVLSSIRAALAIVCCLTSFHAAHAEQIQTVPEIVDADTVYAGPTKIRLGGIDAPEMDQVCIVFTSKPWVQGVDGRCRREGREMARFARCDVFIIAFTP